MKLYRTKEGAFLADEGNGLKAVSDVRTLQGLYGGTIPYETQLPTNYQFAGANEPIAPKIPAQNIPPTQNTNSLINSPIDKFNTYLQSMLQEAQQRGRTATSALTNTASDLAIEGANRASDFSGLEGLSPEQQNAIVSARSGALQPTQRGVEDQLQVEKNKLNEFKDFIERSKVFGEEMAKNIAPSEDITNSFLRLYRAGEDYSDLADASQLQKLLTKVTDEDIATRKSSIKAGKQSTKEPPTSYQEWVLAGGQEGTGQSYSEWIKQGTNVDIEKKDKEFEKFSKEMADKVYNKELTREQARDRIRAYYPDYDENVIYDLVPDVKKK